MISAVDYALAITGIAGPTGQTPDKPVGIVYIALADAADTVVTCHHFHGDRAMVRRRAVNTALDRLRLKLL
jgi:nicotinamide-nucleotide amidase